LKLFNPYKLLRLNFFRSQDVLEKLNTALFAKMALYKNTGRKYEQDVKNHLTH